jgi:hypothetical protein
LSEPSNTAAPDQPVLRRRLLLVAGGALALGGVAAAAALARGPRRADGLPATANLAAAREIGDGFFIVDGWVLTAADLDALRSATPAVHP